MGQKYCNIPVLIMMRFVKLVDVDTIKPFDCGDEDLNGFLHDDARFYNEQLLAYTYLIEEETETVAYFCVLNDKISQTDLDKSLWRKLRKNIPHEKHYDSYPAVKIGRFAVSLKYAGQDIGTLLLKAIKEKLAVNTEYSACRFITVDAYRNAVGFYLKNGFLPLQNEVPEEMPTVPLYYDLIKEQ